MRILELDLKRLPKNSDVVKVFYDFIEEQLPDLDYTVNNSYISYVKGSFLYNKPDRTVVKLTKIDDPDSVITIYYDRFDLTTILFNFEFTEAELEVIKSAGNSAIIVDLLKERLDLEMDPGEFWVDSNYIDFCNYGKDLFNLEATFDNLWFRGNHVLSLTKEP